MSDAVAICMRCGARRRGYDQICPACGHQAIGDGLLIAWLLSAEHLPEADLEHAANRIRSGESIRPSSRQLTQARVALGQHFSSDPGLSTAQRLGLLATSLLLTPLVGWTLWAWWRQTRPRAALQALALSLPASVMFFSLVIWLRVN